MRSKLAFVTALPLALAFVSPNLTTALPGYAIDASRLQAREIMPQSGYRSDNPLQIRVLTRNIAIARGRAGFLIDELQQTYIDREAAAVESRIWQAKVTRKEYAFGMQLSGVAVDARAVHLCANDSCGWECNRTQYGNKDVNTDVDVRIDNQWQEIDVDKPKQLVWEIENKLACDGTRPIISYELANACWQSQLKGFVVHRNSIYNNWRIENV